MARGLKPNNVNGRYEIRVNASHQGRTDSATISQTNALTAAAAARRPESLPNFLSSSQSRGARRRRERSPPREAEETALRRLVPHPRLSCPGHPPSEDPSEKLPSPRGSCLLGLRRFERARDLVPVMLLPARVYEQYWELLERRDWAIRS